MRLLQEFPSIRFRASKPVGDEAGSGLETQALVSQRVALELDERLRQFQQAGQLPSAQTCDLVIVNRSAAALQGPPPPVASSLLHIMAHLEWYRSKSLLP